MMFHRVARLNNLPVLADACCPSKCGDACDVPGVCSYIECHKRETNHCWTTRYGEKSYWSGVTCVTDGGDTKRLDFVPIRVAEGQQWPVEVLLSTVFANNVSSVQDVLNVFTTRWRCCGCSRNTSLSSTHAQLNINAVLAEVTWHITIITLLHLSMWIITNMDDAWIV